MLALKPNCEFCDIDLPPHSKRARICTYECTFCADCVEQVLKNVCPNCGGGFVARPLRPTIDRRPGVSLVHQPASTERVKCKYNREQIERFAMDVKDIAPHNR